MRHFGIALTILVMFSVAVLVFAATAAESAIFQVNGTASKPVLSQPLSKPLAHPRPDAMIDSSHPTVRGAAVQPDVSPFVSVIPVGLHPSGVVYDPARSEIFVSNALSDSVSVISDVTNTVLTTVPVGIGPWGMAYDPDQDEVFVANEESQNLSIINASTAAVTATITLGEPYNPVAISFDVDNGDLYVAAVSSGPVNDVVVVDPKNSTVLAYIDVAPPGAMGYDPCDLAFDADQGDIYVADCGTDLVSVLNTSTNAIVSQITVGGDPLGIVYETNTNELSVTEKSGVEAIISPQSQSVVTNISGLPEGVGYSEQAVAYDGSADEVFASDSAPGLAVVNDTSNTIIANVPFSNETDGIAYDTGNGEIFVAANVFGGYETPPENGVILVLNAKQVLLNNVSLTPSRPSIDQGETIWFNVTDGGYLGPLNYSFETSTFGGCALDNFPMIECSPVSAGNLAVSVNITNVMGNWWVASSSVIVYPILVANLSLSSVTLGLGSTLQVVGTYGGGLDPQPQGFTGLPPGCNGPETGQQATDFGCLPTESGNYTITFEVTDANGASAQTKSNLSIQFVLSVAAPSSTTVGLPVTIHAESAPGFGGLTYSYSGLPPGCLSANVSTLTCTPTKVGTFTVVVAVHDGIGDSSSRELVVHIVPGFLGFSGMESYILFGVLFLGISGVAVTLVVRRGRQPRFEDVATRQNSIRQQKKEGGQVTGKIVYVGKDESDPAEDLV
jgi:YVTN family beta-propeller protein